MSTKSELDRALARAAATAFGGPPRVDRFYDASQSRAIDLLRCVERPSKGLSTYSTLGLYRARNVLDGDDVRVEMAGVAPTSVAEFPNMLATAAFMVMTEGWLCAPGVVFPALLSDYNLSATMQHLLWVPPFPWEQLGSVEVDKVDVHWLLGMPISEGERLLLVARGYNVLEALLAERKAEYFDLDRPSLA